MSERLVSLLVLSSFVILTQSETKTMSDIQGELMLKDTQWFVPGSYGGEGGVYFTDWWSSPDNSRYFPTRPPQQINIRAGGRIDGIQILYGGHKGAYHGGQGGNLHRIRLYDGDSIIAVTGRAGLGPGSGVDQLTFHTKNNKTFGPFGGTGGMPFRSVPPRPSCYLGYISGKSDLRLDKIVFHWRCPAKKEEEKEFTGIAVYDNSETSSSASNLSSLFILISTVIFQLSLTQTTFNTL
ncbi:zymogen granule membrane protein 16 [Eurytemora carolleeae]|uniref:zymogen granule membrane protein 16 n=1 Tax=Eurytemora carolleeae TaxID=1294199 RepID=UPI000C75610E|nr:zymogen granule membrane protein 16 [Eurytemora carolleeae]|eukprot:XP_023325434.1 zymogen granule membrane protein 16-like [Eurytemora affinis]